MIWFVSRLVLVNTELTPTTRRQTMTNLTNLTNDQFDNLFIAELERCRIAGEDSETMNAMWAERTRRIEARQAEIKASEEAWEAEVTAEPVEPMTGAEIRAKRSGNIRVTARGAKITFTPAQLDYIDDMAAFEVPFRKRTFDLTVDEIELIRDDIIGAHDADHFLDRALSLIFTDITDQVEEFTRSACEKCVQAIIDKCNAALKMIAKH